MRVSDWSSDVCSSDLACDSGAALYLRLLADLGCRFSLDGVHHLDIDAEVLANRNFRFVKLRADLLLSQPAAGAVLVDRLKERGLRMVVEKVEDEDALIEVMELGIDCAQGYPLREPRLAKSTDEQTSEPQSLMRRS